MRFPFTVPMLVGSALRSDRRLPRMDPMTGRSGFIVDRQDSDIALRRAIGRRSHGDLAHDEDNREEEEEDRGRDFFFPLPSLSDAVFAVDSLSTDFSGERPPPVRETEVTLVDVDARRLPIGATVVVVETTLKLPAEWSSKLVLGSVVVCSGPDDDGIEMVGLAKLGAANPVRVGISAWRTGHPSTIRQARISRHLSHAAVMPRPWARLVCGDTTFVMTESPEARTLETLIEEIEASQPSMVGPIMPIRTALPLMIDMLRGAVELEELGVAHGNLCEATIHLVDGDTHTVIPDLRSACIAHASGDAVSCAGLARAFHGSAYRHAPEMKDGLPHDVTCNVWQLGLVFSRMLFGGVLPTQWFVSNVAPGLNDSSVLGRLQIREVIREQFKFNISPATIRLFSHGDILGLLAGMLEKDPELRFTAKDALRYAIRVAKDRGLPERPNRTPAGRPQFLTGGL